MSRLLTGRVTGHLPVDWLVADVGGSTVVARKPLGWKVRIGDRVTMLERSRRLIVLAIRGD